MCEPATIAMAAAAIGSGVTAMQSIVQGQAAKSQANYQAAVARNNKIIADRAADQAEETGRAEAARVQQDSASLRARQRAVLAANGVSLGFGSANDIEESTALVGQLDALTYQERARRQAENLRFRGDMFESEAQLSKLAGEQKQRDSLFNAAVTVADGTASVAGKWAKYKTTKLTPSPSPSPSIGTSQYP